MVIKRGSIIVLKATEARFKMKELSDESVFFVDSKFPLEQFQMLIDQKFYEAREATKEEQEYCYWCYETIDKPGCDISGFNHWRQWKAEQNPER